FILSQDQTLEKNLIKIQEHLLTFLILVLTVLKVSSLRMFQHSHVQNASRSSLWPVRGASRLARPFEVIRTRLPGKPAIRLPLPSRSADFISESSRSFHCSVIKELFFVCPCFGRLD
ncbi:MAG: hypothetical protein II640_08825, partial [Lachnospiraceae bacterium]|nr:hypothetical protein [Lachnospiraceae bacterium]